MAYGYHEEEAAPGAQDGEEDSDALKAAFASLLMKTTDMDAEEIYSIVFRFGSRITWH